MFRTHRDEIGGIAAHLPAVRSVELRSRTQHARGTLELVHRWYGTKSALPALIRPAVPQDLLVWDQRTVWDPAGWVADWTIDVFSVGGAVVCDGRNTYLEGRRGCVIEVRGDFAFRPERVPQLSGVPRAAVPVVERAVVSVIVPLIKQTGAAVAAYLAA